MKAAIQEGRLVAEVRTQVLADGLTCQIDLGLPFFALCVMAQCLEKPPDRLELVFTDHVDQLI